MTDLLAFVAVLSACLIAGLLVAAVVLLQWIDRCRKRSVRDGFVGTDMSWPGKPIRIVDIETAARETH